MRPVINARANSIACRPIPEPELQPKTRQYSVYFLVVDSQAHTQLHRNMPRTLEYLTETMKATNFPWVNVVGRNSRPNGFGWMYGKNSKTYDKKPYGLPSIEADPYWEHEVNCNRSAVKDFNVSLVMDFARRGYVTASVEDWYMLFVYGCLGISTHPFHHIYNPYVIEYDKNLKTWHHKYEKQCLPRHRHALVYLSQFAQSYVDQPKFAFSWFSHVGHNSEWGTKDLDVDMYNFLSLNKNEKLRREVGKLDILNAALIIALPKELRGNEELRRVMEENAQDLQTHFDTRATILDILRNQPASNFTNHTFMKVKGELGHSYFREQSGSRSCTVYRDMSSERIPQANYTIL